MTAKPGSRRCWRWARPCNRAGDVTGARDAVLVTAAELAIAAGEEKALLRALLPLEQAGSGR